MSKVILKSNLQNLAFKKESAYVTRAVAYTTIDSEAFLDRVKDNSGIDKGTVYAVADAIAKEFRNFIANGHTVSVPGIGHFRFVVNAKAAATAEEAGAGKVYRRKVVYTPVKALKTILKNTTLVSNVIEGEDGGEDEPEP